MTEQIPEQNPCGCGCTGMHTSEAVKTSKSALWSLICGIASLLICLATVPAIILGIIGLTKIKKSNGVLKGNGLAIAGLVLGGVLLSFWVIVGIIAAIAIPNIIQAKNLEMTYRTQFDIRNISQSLEMYNADYGVYPTAEQGLQILVKNEEGHSYMDKIPNDPWGRQYHYRYPGSNNSGLYDLWSDGKDGIEGTMDDIANWKE